MKRPAHPQHPNSPKCSTRGWRSVATALGLGLLAACGHEWAINGYPVHTPQPLLAVPALDDTALTRCLRDHVREARIQHRNGVVSLDCPHAGIESLTGLEHYTALQELRLEGNRLRHVGLLQSLPNLMLLDLRGNDTLDCNSLPAPVVQASPQIAAPAHCLH